MKRLASILAAALFTLTACAPAAETATAETLPETEATAEPTSEPAAAETGPLYTYSHRYAQDVVYDVMPALNDQFDYIGTNVYKNDLNAGQVSLFYSCDDWCLADPYVTSDARCTCSPATETATTKSLPCRRMAPKHMRFLLTHTPRPLSYTATVIFIAQAVLPPMIPQAGSVSICKPVRQRHGTCPPRQPPHRMPPVILP